MVETGSTRLGLAIASLVALVAASGCDHAAPAPPSRVTSVTTASPLVSSPPPIALSSSVERCTFGGVGVLPANGRPEDYYRVVAYVTVRSPRALAGASVRAVEVTGSAGTEATLKRLESVERIDADKALPNAGAMARGTPFDGALGEGETRLRVEAWLTDKPRSRPATVRVEVGTDAARASATCQLTVEWPT